MTDGFTFEVNDREVLAHLASIPEKLRAKLRIVIYAEALALEDHVKSDKLSGQVLNVVTGRLRRSIFSRLEETEKTIEGAVASSGDVKYARIHEFGFHGTETVAAHTREIRQAFGRAISPKEVFVREHSRRVNMKERSFLRSALADRRDHIIAAIQKAAEGL